MNNFLERITLEDGKCGGRPCIRGKRIRVCDILELNLLQILQTQQIVEIR